MNSKQRLKLLDRLLKKQWKGITGAWAYIYIALVKEANYVVSTVQKWLEMGLYSFRSTKWKNGPAQHYGKVYFKIFKRKAL